MDNEEIKKKLRGMLDEDFTLKELSSVMDLMNSDQLRDFMEGMIDGYKDAIKDDPSLEKVARDEGILDELYVRKNNSLN